MEQIITQRIALNQRMIAILTKKQEDLEKLLKLEPQYQEILIDILKKVKTALWNERLETYILKQTLECLALKGRRKQSS